VMPSIGNTASDTGAAKRARRTPGFPTAETSAALANADTIDP
jgi:hypothetical protein